MVGGNIIISMDINIETIARSMIKRGMKVKKPDRTHEKSCWKEAKVNHIIWTAIAESPESRR